MSDKQPITGYGFEFFSRQSYNREVVAAKGGDLYGFHSYMWLLPEHGVGAMYVTNTDATASYDGIFKSFMDHYYPKTVEKQSISSDPHLFLPKNCRNTRVITATYADRLCMQKLLLRTIFYNSSQVKC